MTQKSQEGRDTVSPLDSAPATKVTPELPIYDQVPQLEDSVVLGLNADMTSGAAQSGESIRRGIQLAVEEINREGGLLGRPVELIVRDHRGNPERGVHQIDEFAEFGNVLAVFSGIHTPVAIPQLEPIHRHQLLFLVPWAAGTPIIDNGNEPNFAFRVSVRDEYAGDFLAEHVSQHGFRRPALLLERTSWGRSSKAALDRALGDRGLAAADTQWVHWGEQNVDGIIEHFLADQCDCIVLVTNPREGALVVEAVSELPEDSRLPILSHWGITGGNFLELTNGAAAEIDLAFIQTWFFATASALERARTLADAYIKTFDDTQNARGIVSPTGTVHAYELTMMLWQAVKECESVDPVVVRTALEQMKSFDGLFGKLEPPFTPQRHDALGLKHLQLGRYAQDGAIVPFERAQTQ